MKVLCAEEKNIFLRSIFLVVILNYFKHVQCSLQGEEVSKWANTIGDDLWKLGREVTKMAEISQKYKFLNAQVKRQDPESLLAEIKMNIMDMMDRKTDAIKCIQREAEKVAEEFVYNQTLPFAYRSSKYSAVENSTTEVKPPKSLKKGKRKYLPMKFNNDTHFYNLAVNTSYSSVHVPTNVYDLGAQQEDAVAEAIQWSEALDKVFTSNYKSDPALFWQYFGSSKGIMRTYPATHWADHKRDTFDCRIRTWYIEAATCTKDVIILMDNSGSMEGMGKHIGSLVVYSILDTFSNNDYVNILNYSDTTNYLIPCFENLLVQATKENIRAFKTAVETLQPSGKTNLDKALDVAFDILSAVREKKNCSENSTSCNQAIMIVSDGVNGNLSDIVMERNRLSGGNIPVRIFAYLVGKEVANPQEVMWMACTNRGYYSQVQSLEQVTAAVFQYINVIARPLVLQGTDHPPSWTHAYADPTYDALTDIFSNEPYRLLTSVAIPLFNSKINNMNDSVTAELLGVAGTDIPLDEFRKLTLPYKIGVNGYSFIVSNNGYVLMHPDLRPVFEGVLKENFNSIDLTQVEQLDEDLPPREISPQLKDLRNALVFGLQGKIRNVKLKYHYDDFKRVAEETYDYYFAPLEESPFSVAISVPSTYGHYYIDVSDQIEKNRHTGVDLTSYFVGKWKIHPKWVYCKYHYLENHEFKSPELELLNFLGKMYDSNFTWVKQYNTSFDITTVDCGKSRLDEDDYYCDKQLVQRLIFDARNTNDSFKEQWTFNSESERALFRRFNVTLRFIATMSGLTRWEYISVDSNTTDANSTKSTKSKTKEFGDIHPRAIDEKWYKNAVLQHQYDTDSFVYSVPFDAGMKEDSLVTGSYAIFPEDAGIKAPGSVVGFQFSQAKLKERFHEVSTRLSNQCHHCGKCTAELDCYIIDSSGYILVSENQFDTGRFFGEVEGDILESMLKRNIFKRKVFYDYQALCRIDEEPRESRATNLFTPLDYLLRFSSWVLLKIVYLFVEINVYNMLNPLITLAQDIATTMSNNETFSDDYLYDEEDEDEEDDYVEIENEADHYFPCEKQVNLFILQQSLFIKDNFHGEITTDEDRPYYVKRIPNSNLVFVAIKHVATVNKPCFTTNPIKISKAPKWDIVLLNSTLLPCQKLQLNLLPRRRLKGCYNDHPLEREIKECGKCSFNGISIVLIVLNLLVQLFI